MHFASEASKYASIRFLDAEAPRNSFRLFAFAQFDKHNIHIWQSTRV